MPLASLWKIPPTARSRMTAPHGSLTRDPTAALLPPCFFAMAVAAFALALVAAPFLLDEVAAFFYQPHVLALTHVLTLGWVSLTMQGVLYRYVPGLTKRPIPYPRLAVVQCASFATGAAGLVVGFWVHRWWPVVGSAGLLVASASLLCANMWPMLRASPQRGVAEVGLMVSTGFLVVAAALGMLLALDKSWSVLHGNVLTNLAAHAHLAAIGWVGLTIVAASRSASCPPFSCRRSGLTPIAKRLVVALAVAVAVLATLLLVRSDVAWAAAGVLTALVLVYVGLVLRVVAHRRLPMDWTAWHAVAGAGWVTFAALTGVVLAWVGGDACWGTARRRLRRRRDRRLDVEPHRRRLAQTLSRLRGGCALAARAAARSDRHAGRATRTAVDRVRHVERRHGSARRGSPRRVLAGRADGWRRARGRRRALRRRGGTDTPLHPA